MRALFPRWRAIAIAIVAITVALAGTVTSVGAAPAIDAPERHRRVVVEPTSSAMRLPPVDAAIKLDCAPRIASDTDRIDGAVHCEWRSEADVRSWQLWNLQLRPTHGHRNLVAELGADAQAHTDVNVEVPGHYLYAVLGLDGSGEIIARSRIVSVKLLHRDIEVEPMRLTCEPHRTDHAPVDGRDALPSFAIGCHWSEVSNDAAVGYVLYRSVDGGERSVLARVDLDTTSVRDDEVRAGHRYTYVVTAVDGAGHVVGRSRAETVGVPVPEVDRPERDTLPERDVPERDVPERDVPVRDVPERDVPERDLPVRDEPERDRPERDRSPDAPTDRITDQVRDRVVQD